MGEMNEYLTGEVVVDYGDGLIDRREALRRLGLLGVAAGTAATLLAACDAQGGPGPGSASGSSTAGPAASGPTSAAPAPTSGPAGQAVTFPGREGRTLRGSWAAATTPRGAVLIIHENRGLTDHFKALPRRLAGAGYSALAVDLLSAEGGTDRYADSAEATAALNAAPRDGSSRT
jgi:carboxymethylenebutenolidase